MLLKYSNIKIMTYLQFNELYEYCAVHLSAQYILYQHISVNKTEYFIRLYMNRIISKVSILALYCLYYSLV